MNAGELGDELGRGESTDTGQFEQSRLLLRDQRDQLLFEGLGFACDLAQPLDLAAHHAHDLAVWLL
ncbi:MAG: hypothetical protein ACXVH3_33155 [Solirubrobacteraceae bacterium]